MNNKLNIVRTERGMSISELARRSGLSRTALIKIEKGKSDPLASSMYAISCALDKQVSEIFFDPDVIQEYQKEVI